MVGFGTWQVEAEIGSVQSFLPKKTGFLNCVECFSSKESWAGSVDNVEKSSNVENVKVFVLWFAIPYTLYI